jgi:REP element-mobilizing transposase RayT
MNKGDLPFQFFDPEGDVLVTLRKKLPHWAQSGTLCLITWRTWDSLPAAVLQDWQRKRMTWLVNHGIDPARDGWQAQVRSLPPDQQREFHQTISKRWEDSLDECHGSCVLGQPELSQIVADSLHHFDGERYLLTDFVVMPNHVHILAAFHDLASMLAQCDSWKHYTAGKINAQIGRRGRFWQVDDFDHLVRSLEQFERLRTYIAENPNRAKLRDGEFRHYARTTLLWPNRQLAERVDHTDRRQT